MPARAAVVSSRWSRRAGTPRDVHLDRWRRHRWRILRRHAASALGSAPARRCSSTCCRATKATGTALPDRIRDAGITALTIDLRGHGAIVRIRAGLQAMIQDVRAAAQWLATRPTCAPTRSPSSAPRSAPVWRCWRPSELPQVRSDRLAVAVARLSRPAHRHGARSSGWARDRSGWPRARKIRWRCGRSANCGRNVRAARADGVTPPRTARCCSSATATSARALVDWLRRSLLS